MNKDECLATIDEISKLERGFNGYDALPIDKSVIEQARTIVDILKYQPFIVPTGRRTIQFEYHISNPTKHYMEFEIYSDKIDILICHDYDYEYAYELTLSKNDNQLDRLQEQLDFFFNSVYE